MIWPPAIAPTSCSPEKDIDEALATAKENGLLDECDWEIDDNGELQTFYIANDFGRDMIQRYIR